MDKETELTRKRYNRTSKFYDMERMIKPAIRKTILNQVEGKILEVGVGTGKNLAYYPPNSNITGIDLSPGMLAKARDKARKLQIPARLLEMDAQDLQFPENSFDTVVATCVFCSVPDPISGLKEIKRVCKPGGKILLLEHVRSDNPLLGRIMDLLDPLTVRMIGSHINRRTVENVTKADLRILSVEEQGFTILKNIVAEPNKEPI
ncbi:class I SAM-dependent methyltransferase [Desulfitobacterium hafniense]|nr:class I SAM-dependent methyltransferase [Desulfitobacterium hafniense]CDX00885.1 Response regulator receiver protein [Desulfitobacterium hafniense]